MLGNLAILLRKGGLKVFKWKRCVSSGYTKYLRLRDTKLTYRLIDSKLSSKPGTRTNLETVIAEYVTIRTYLYNGLAYTATKVN